MKRNPHPDYVRERLKRWRTRLVRACTEVVKLERALARAENKRAAEALGAKIAARAARRARAAGRTQS